MRTFAIFSSFTLLLCAMIFFLCLPADSQTAGSFIALQSASPGTAQVGHTNISGTSTAGQFKGGSASINQSVNNIAVHSVNSSPNQFASAFNGQATSIAAENYGGYFLSAGVNGTGCVGISTLTSGYSNGGFFRSSATGGNGVFAIASATTGDAYGGLFLSFSNAGVGIYGEANATSGITNGVYGVSASPFGTGVRGVATATSGNPYGVLGISETGTGVTGYGRAGGHFESYGENSTGVQGISQASGVGYGGFFAAYGNTYVVAVDGLCTTTTGVAYGVRGTVASPNGWAGYFSGGKGLFTDRLSVGTSNSTYPIQMADEFGDKISLYGAGSTSVGFGVQGNALQIHTDYVGSDVVFGFGSSAALSETMRVKGNGNVGIGTSTPASKLDVNGRTTTDDFTMSAGGAANTVLLGAAGGVGSWGTVGSARLTSDAASLSKVTNGNFSMSNGDMQGADEKMIQLFTGTTEKVRMDPRGSAAGGNMFVYGPNGNLNAQASFLAGNPDNGYLTVNDSAGAIQASLNVNANGLGVLTADTKNFKVPDPEDPRYDILYACVEGPEAAMYTRGTGQLVNGRAVIDLPDHFLKLANMGTVTVTLTPRDDCEGLYYKNMNGEIVVKELRKGQSNIEFDWRIEAVRKGHENYRVVRPWDDALPEGDKKQQWEARLKSIEMRADLKRSNNQRP